MNRISDNKTYHIKEWIGPLKTGHQYILDGNKTKKMIMETDITLEITEMMADEIKLFEIDNDYDSIGFNQSMYFNE